MRVRIGPHDFDTASYDADADVLYLRAGERREPNTTYGTPEGHAVSFDADGSVIAMTIVNAKWLLERDGKLAITVPRLIEARVEDLAPALAATP